MAENLEELESSVGVPAFILERSAAARAEATGSSAEAVIADWTGGEAPAAAPSASAEAEPAPAAAAADASGMPAAESLSGDALLEVAAAAKGIPVSLVERSAQARADADKVPVEQVMREWVVEAGLATAGAAAAAPPAAVESPRHRSLAASHRRVGGPPQGWTRGAPGQNTLVRRHPDNGCRNLVRRGSGSNLARPDVRRDS